MGGRVGSARYGAMGVDMRHRVMTAMTMTKTKTTKAMMVALGPSRCSGGWWPQSGGERQWRALVGKSKGELIW